MFRRNFHRRRRRDDRTDPAAIERLPETTGLKNEVLILTAIVTYGAPVDQAIRLAGAKVVPVGQATFARRYQFEGAITERTAAAVYVVSHHVVDYGLSRWSSFPRSVTRAACR